MKRTTTLFLVVGEPDTSRAQECPACGFDALLAFPLTALSLNGVGPAGSVDACARCYEEGSP